MKILKVGLFCACLSIIKQTDCTDNKLKSNLRKIEYGNKDHFVPRTQRKTRGEAYEALNFMQKKTDLKNTANKFNLAGREIIDCNPKSNGRQEAPNMEFNLKIDIKNEECCDKTSKCSKGGKGSKSKPKSAPSSASKSPCEHDSNSSSKSKDRPSKEKSKPPKPEKSSGRPSKEKSKPSKPEKSSGRPSKEKSKPQKPGNSSSGRPSKEGGESKNKETKKPSGLQLGLMGEMPNIRPLNVKDEVSLLDDKSLKNSQEKKEGGLDSSQDSTKKTEIQINQPALINEKSVVSLEEKEETKLPETKLLPA